MRIQEINESQDKILKIKQFYNWAIKRLSIKNRPKLHLGNNKDRVDSDRTFGSTTNTGEVWVYVGNRNAADVMRTLIHELVHVKQFEDGTATTDMDEQDHFRVEDEANAVAGRIMREYGKKHVEIYENSGSLQHEVADSLPQAFVIPGLNSSNPYEQYKFGVAIANARGAPGRAADNVPPFADHTLQKDWADNEVIISYDSHIDKIIDSAMKEAGVKGKKRRIGVSGSKESPTVAKGSPVKPFKGFGR